MSQRTERLGKSCMMVAGKSMASYLELKHLELVDLLVFACLMVA